MGISRRNLLFKGGLAAVGTGIAGLALSQATKAIGSGDPQVKIPELPWPYKKLDPLAVAEAAYEGYYKAACGFGAFDSIIEPLRKEVGFPFTVMPSGLFIIGQGGVAETASLCGALHGASGAIFLVSGGFDRKNRDLSYSIIQDLFLWYEQTSLPDYRPKNPRFEIAKTVAGSTLCHVSVSKWCKATKFKAFSKERSDRCGWITAAVAKQAAELLNKYADGPFKATHTLPAAAQSCRKCHDRGSKLENTRGITDCGGCHFTPAMLKSHPKF